LLRGAVFERDAKLAPSRPVVPDPSCVPCTLTLMPYPIPVFLYHRIDTDDDPFTVDPDRFALHLELIAASGRTSLTMTELAQALRGEQPLPPAAVGLTFDDGYADTCATLESAAALGVKSTLYVTTGAIDTPAAITTDDLIRLADSEFAEIGAHTVTHPRLDELPSAAAAREIIASRDALTAAIGGEIRSFAYPHGAYSARIRRLVVDAGFGSAAAVKNALSHTDDDSWAIARYTITAATPLSQIEALLRGEGAPLAWHRERARTRGYRVARVAQRKLREFREDGHSASPGSAPSSTAAPPGDRIANLQAPVAIVQVDLDAPNVQVRLPEPAGTRPYTGVAVLARYHETPVAWTVLPPPPDGVLSTDQLPPELRRHERPSEAPDPAIRPAVSVVITTCADAPSTVACVSSLLASEHLPAEVIVVENRPAESTVGQKLQEAFPDPPLPVRVVLESRRGLSAARNAGLIAASSEIVAFTDDDITVDRYWLGALSRAFALDPTLSCVTGLILPLELETDAQVAFERFSGLGKGFARRRYSMSARQTPDIPLFPYAAGYFGSGANTSFRRTALLELGGFDPLLGAGTRTHGGEDIDIFIRLLTTGRDLTYEPAAIVWHRHPADEGQVRARTVSYGVGFGAVAGKLLASRQHRRALIRLAPMAVVYWFNPRSRKNLHRAGGATSRAEQVRETAGVGLGLVAYAVSRLSTLRAHTGKAFAETDRSAFTAIWSGQLELTSPVLPERLVGADRRALHLARLLVRAAGTPIGFVELPAPGGSVGVEEAVDIAEVKLGEQAAVALSDTAWTTIRGPKVSVVLCTHNRTAGVRRTLESLMAMRYEDIEILVVDNAPADETTLEVVSELAAADVRVRYVREPLKGLSRARNRGLAEATGEFIAFTDDDVRVDELWVHGLLRGFSRRTDVACVTGLVASSSLEQPAEQYFDRRVWWSSSCDQHLYVAARAQDDSPFHPYASGAFGTGANFASRVQVLRRLGGFDQCLGAGSPTRGGEDLDIFVRILRAGHAISYEPSALVWHHHRVTDAELRDQMYSYGLGLSAYMTKLMLAGDTRRDVLRRGRGLLRHGMLLLQRSRRARFEAGEGDGLTSAELRGVLAGPFAYVRARRQENRQHLAEVAP